MPLLLTLLCACSTPRNVGLKAAAASRWPDVSTQATAGSRRDDVVVLVAIEDYAFLPDVPGATANAEAWRSYFEGAMGIERIYTAYDHAATREGMQTAIRRAAEDVGVSSA